VEDADTDFRLATWIVGFSVSDVKASVSTSRKLGSDIIHDVAVSEGIATWAAIEEPLGEQFMVLESKRELGIKEEGGRFV